MQHGRQALRRPSTYEFDAGDLDIGSPVQIMASAGDIVLSHFLTGHLPAPNVSAEVRYAVFFRCFGKSGPLEEGLTNPWAGWTTELPAPT